VSLGFDDEELSVYSRVGPASGRCFRCATALEPYLAAKWWCPACDAESLPGTVAEPRPEFVAVEAYVWWCRCGHLDVMSPAGWAAHRCPCGAQGTLPLRVILRVPLRDGNPSAWDVRAEAGGWACSLYDLTRGPGERAGMTLWSMATTAARGGR